MDDEYELICLWMLYVWQNFDLDSIQFHNRVFQGKNDLQRPRKIMNWCSSKY